MTSELADCVVVGAGVIGLAIARKFALAGREVIVIEESDHIGSGTSSRNSEVIHAGIYYPANSLKARLCVDGRRQLYDYCESHHVPVGKIGKYIVATSDDQVTRLDDILQAGRTNGVEGLEIISANQAQRQEPNLACKAAIFSPETGIIDSHAFMLALQGDAEAAGAMIAFNSKVEAVDPQDSGYRIRISGADEFELNCSILINAAGQGAIPLAEKTEGLSRATVPKARFAKGNYFRLAAKAPFSRLIYPVPISGGLGVHLTLDLGGHARFGPDVEWVGGLEYEVDPTRAEKFYAEVRKYWPALPDGSLLPDYSGIRPILYGPGEPVVDFIISDERHHGLPGLVNLFGMESPGLTSALAIADEVMERV